MSIFKALFGPGTDPKSLKKHCYEIELLPAELSDMSPYRCQLGGGLLNDPVKDKHGHKMCRGCANERITAGVNCDVEENHKHKLRKEELTADRQTDFLSCRCPNARQLSNRCDFSFFVKDYKDYITHRNNCPKQLITCTSQDCQGMIFREDLTEHLSSRCLYVPWKCPHCRMEMLRKEAKHHEQVCQEWPVPCQNKECPNELKRKTVRLHVDRLCGHTRIKCPKVRCSVRFLRKDIEHHEPLCEFRDTECQYCKNTYEKADKNVHESTCKEFPLECMHKDCGLTLPRRLWEPHYHNDCPMKEISCPSDGCAERILQKNREDHLAVCEDHKLCCEHCKTWVKRKFIERHYKVCPEYPIQCQNLDKCEIIVRRGQRDAHILMECPYTELPCKYACNRCPERYLRKDLQAHERDCDYQPSPCRLCGSVMPRITIESHIEAECPEHTIGCIQNCSEKVLRRLMRNHIDSTCGETIVECEYKQFGCTMTFHRKQTQEHLERLLSHHHTLILRLNYGLRRQNAEILEKQNIFNQQLGKLADVMKGLVVTTGRIDAQNRANLDEIHVTTTLCQDIIRGQEQVRYSTNELNNRVNQLGTLMASIKGDVSNVERKVKSLSSQISSCESEIKNTKRAVEDVGRKVDRLPHTSG